MAEQSREINRDLVLAPGEFAFVLDTTKGLINTYVGPIKNSMSNTDQPVLWDKAKRRSVKCDVDDAIQINSVAPEGFYVALYNPAEAEGKLTYPREGAVSSTTALKVGHRINIHGPVHFPLWPGQFAEVIKGHHLRSNQYLLAQVYNDAEATANWKKAVVKPAGNAGDAMIDASKVFAPGQLLIIKGTDVAFFMPPTGVKVVPEIAIATEGGKSTICFVREAVTLERLEYCILLDEDGNKRFVQGPAVVFPEPTETFVLKDGKRKFLAIELNKTTGIYVKVIADYDDEKGEPHKAGEELFITGDEQAIYFQREEHSVIRYGEQTKHYAVAIPSGEGRYVLNRVTGVISLVHGPRMLLCDPRYEVIVRRVLAQGTAALWYPGNQKVLDVNRALEAMNTETGASAYEAGRAMTTVASYSLMSNSLAALNASDEVAIRSSRQIAGDTFKRSTTFTPPRTITLDTKYEGVVTLSIWTGYAALIINKTGDRRVAVGPENVMLEYDETLAPLELSTGKPKDDKALFKTVYLRVSNNKVSDVIAVETKDLVSLNISVSYRVNFEGENQERWFAVENYVKLLSDHVRSKIRNAAKRIGIEEFYGNAIDIVRDTVLGKASEVGGRPGLAFDENNMHVYDVEVLSVTIVSANVASLLNATQLNALKSTIQITEDERNLAIVKRAEVVKRAIATTVAETVAHVNAAGRAEVQSNLDLAMARIAASAATDAASLKAQNDKQATITALSTAEIERSKATDDERLRVKEQEIALELKRIVGETEEIVKRAEAVDDNLVVALTAFADQNMIKEISTALAPTALMSGVSATDILAQLFHGTPFKGVMEALGSRTRMAIKPANGEAART